MPELDEREVTERFAANFARARERAGLSQEELAFRARVHHTSISTFQTARRLPSTLVLVKLAGALGIQVADLLEGIVWEPASMSVLGGGFKAASEADDPR
jgi:transcriptional regulator with XRE-family HTH domain